MDVINMSFGSQVELFSSLQNYVLDRITRLGVIVVMSTGNGGPFPDTVGDGADDPSVIAVGGTQNDREFAGSVAASGVSTITATSGAYAAPLKPVTAPLADMSLVDPQTLGCGTALPANTLTGAIAVTQTTSGCLFETVLNNAAKAGAVGVIFYPTSATALRRGVYSPLAATLPSVYVGNADGIALKKLIAAKTPVTVTFEGVPAPNDPRVLASFSSHGPTDFSTMKPDISATGSFVYMATQSTDPTGELYHSAGYIQEDGTSFSAPMVAGAAAVLKGARPGLSMDQYRSLLINSTNPLVSADGSLEKLQRTGSGVLNLNSALVSTVTTFPTSISFGTGDANLSSYDLIAITNVGSQTETFTVSAIPYDLAPAPNFSSDGSNVYLGKTGSGTLSIALAPKQSSVVYALWVAKNLPPGEFQGQIVVRGGTTGSTALIPYWYANPDGVPQFLNTLGVPTQANVGAQIGLFFKVTDGTGTAVLNPFTLNVKSSVVAGGGKLQGPFEDQNFVNWLYFVATLSGTPGANTFQYQVQGFPPLNYTIQGVKPGAGSFVEPGTWWQPTSVMDGAPEPIRLRAQ
jgi:hypothetical protein